MPSITAKIPFHARAELAQVHPKCAAFKGITRTYQGSVYLPRCLI